MFISKKKHAKSLKELLEIIDQKKGQIECLEIGLKQARDFKAILEKLYPLACSPDFILGADGRYSVHLSDDIPQYVEDMLGGKVIKQEATKVIKILQTGEIKTGLTKQPKDKGYCYKLIRD